MTTSRTDLPKLVDLALGTPEIGAVNFNVLHALLHAIVKLLNVQDVKVQLEGIPITSNSSPHPSFESPQFTVHEYKMDGSNEILIENTVENFGRLFIVKKYDGNGSQIQRVEGGQNLSKGNDDSRGNDEEETVKKASVQETDEPLQKIHDDFDPGRFLESFTKWELRMNKAETKLTEVELNLAESNNQLSQRIESLHNNWEEGRKLAVEGNEKRQCGGATKAHEIIMQEIQNELDSLKTEVTQIKEKLKDEAFKKETMDKHTQDECECSPNSRGQFIYRERDDQFAHCSPLETPVTCTEQNYCPETTQNLSHRVEILNIKFITLNDRFLDMEKELSNLIDHFQSSSQNLNLNKDILTSQLQDDFIAQKTSLDELMRKIDVVMNEKYELNKQIRDLTRALEELAENKLDKQDIEEMLSEKADYTMLQHKVSLEHFEASKRLMDATMTDIIDQLQHGEASWNIALQDMMNKITHKADSDDITSLKEYMENKVERMWERMNTTLNSGGTEPEAAGASVKLMRNLNCISCAQHVMMKTEEAARFARQDALKGSKSSKPFLTYELDNIRKNMKNLSCSRDMNHFESIYKGNKQSNINRLCNRYCGGSHTVINTRSKVERTRHLGLSCVPERKPTCDCRKVTSNPPMQRNGDIVGEPPVEGPATTTNAVRKDPCSYANERMLQMCRNDEDFLKTCTQEMKGTESNRGSQIKEQFSAWIEQGLCSDDVKRREVCNQYLKEFDECGQHGTRKSVSPEKGIAPEQEVSHGKTVTPEKDAKSKTSLKAENEESTIPAASGEEVKGSRKSLILDLEIEEEFSQTVEEREELEGGESSWDSLNEEQLDEGGEYEE